MTAPESSKKLTLSVADAARPGVNVVVPESSANDTLAGMPKNTNATLFAAPGMTDTRWSPTAR